MSNDDVLKVGPELLIALVISLDAVAKSLNLNKKQTKKIKDLFAEKLGETIAQIFIKRVERATGSMADEVKKLDIKKIKI